MQVSPSPNNINDFYYDLKGHLPPLSSGNQVFSPLSLAIALEMCALIVEKPAKDEILTALHITAPLSEGHIQQQMKLANTIVNSAWLNETIDFRPDDFAPIHDIALVSAANFPDEVIKKVNEYVNEKTNGMIPQALASLPPLAVFLIVNVIYFKQDWVTSFNKTKTQDCAFHGPSGIVNVQMMTVTETFEYYTDREYRRLTMLYKDHSSMTIILPTATDAAELDEIDIKQALAGRGFPMPIKVVMPRFKIESRFDNLIDTVANVGIVKIADDTETGCCFPNKTRISMIAQAAAIETNEEGTQAAAFTVMVRGASIRCATRPPNFVVDHPFIYVVRAVDGTIMFAGSCVNPL